MTESSSVSPSVSSSVPPGTGPLAPQFSGIDPVLMGAFITELERAGQVIAEQAENIRRELTTVDLPAAGLAPIREIGGWAEQELPRLRQRLETITSPMPGLAGLAGVPGLPGIGLRAYQETSLLTPAEARRQGTALGERFAAIDPDEFRLTGPYASDRIAEALKELSAHRHDAVYNAAFFAALGPEGPRKIAAAVERLPREDRPDAIMLAGTAFAAAITGGASVAGFAAVLKAAEKTKTADPGDRDDAEDIDAVAALLSHGDYPDVWLAEFARPALSPDSRVSASALTDLLNALGNNPAAARLAIGSAVRFGPGPGMPSLALPFGRIPATPEKWERCPDLATFLRGLHDRASTSPQSADAFGRLLAAASSPPPPEPTTNRTASTARSPPPSPTP
ncbi:hypothetical protein [Spongiactinospora sp. TRM90649]|uniref:hypothetical protein n=1 Tax=Spongiactinospora sp. TRM90649 TaxID=3031114 RepID=UPI0023F7969A|nr:hypothetical protein [Spongiactinospora sp. TRM90649]MDF5756259.1 hypothetical protein [Spongiactinospora sp. TRM90649]